jgi:hypothetical protein
LDGEKQKFFQMVPTSAHLKSRAKFGKWQKRLPKDMGMKK